MAATSAYINNCAESASVPNEFICPLTLEVMVNPLMDKCGRSYERSAILEWITTQNSTCPMTRRPLYVTDLISNNRLRKEITQWRQELGDDTNVDTCTHEPSREDILQEELARAFKVWGEKHNFGHSNTRQGRGGNSHRHHSRMSSRIMRFFDRQVQAY